VAADWLIDLEAWEPPSRLGVMVNGRPVAGPAQDWVRFHPPDGHGPVAQLVYERFCAFCGRPMATYPQWWRLRVDPHLLDGCDRVCLTLARDPGPSASRICLGGRLCQGSLQRFQGPSLRSFLASSYLRWTVTDDWRMSETWRTAAVETRSRIVESGATAGREIRTLAALLGRHQGEFNIRLLVQYKSGRSVLY
jgi:hypothetical protein